MGIDPLTNSQKRRHFGKCHFGARLRKKVRFDEVAAGRPAVRKIFFTYLAKLIGRKFAIRSCATHATFFFQQKVAGKPATN